MSSNAGNLQHSNSKKKTEVGVVVLKAMPVVQYAGVNCHRLSSSVILQEDYKCLVRVSDNKKHHSTAVCPLLIDWDFPDWVAICYMCLPSGT